MKNNLFLIFSVFFGGMMISTSFSFLGETGNKVMHLIGTILVLYALVTIVKMIYKGKN